MAGTTTLPTIPAPSIAPVPAATNVAPTTPPISACELLEGRPKYQVRRFQAIAPTRPANTTVGVIAPWSTMSFAIVAATARERKAPTKFSSAASATATRGGSARVETEVATTFAVSWNPLVKSKARAVATTMAMVRSPLTGS